MANVTLGAIFPAQDESLGSQRVHLIAGVASSSTLRALNVTDAGSPILGASTSNIGDVDVVSLPTGSVAASTTLFRSGEAGVVQAAASTANIGRVVPLSTGGVAQPAGTSGDPQHVIVDNSTSSPANVSLTGPTGAHGAVAPGSAVVVAGYDGTSIRFLRMANSDSISVGSLLSVVPTASNGDRWRNNLEGTLLASAARTATVASADQTNHNARGVALVLRVTVASTSGLLDVRIASRDPVTSGSYNLNINPTGIGATGTFVYQLYPGASSTGPGGTGVHQYTAAALPRTWLASVIHSSTNSFTYSLGYQLIV